MVSWQEYLHIYSSQKYLKFKFLNFFAQDDIAALGLSGSDPNGFSSYNPSDANTILNTGASEVMRNHMQVRYQ